MKARYQRIATAYASTERQLNRTRVRIADTNAGIRRTESDMGELREKLKDRVRAAYRMRGIGFFEMLLKARSFRDFSVRMISLQQLALQDEGVILQLRKKQAELEARLRERKRQAGILASQRSTLRGQAHELSISFSQAQALVRDLRGQLRVEELARLFRIYRGGGRGFALPLDACPVAGPHVVSNDFGAPRGGGSRRHQGNDIMAPMGTPLVAVVAGAVTKRGSGGLGGLSIWLRGGGASFYYAHLSRFASSGGRVNAGQVIGYNGDSGNARGGPPHLHFEIHPGGGRAIDPFPSLSRVC